MARRLARRTALALLVSVVLLAGCAASRADRISDPDRHYALIHFTRDGYTHSSLAVADDPATFTT